MVIGKYHQWISGPIMSDYFQMTIFYKVLITLKMLKGNKAERFRKRERVKNADRCEIDGKK